MKVIGKLVGLIVKLAVLAAGMVVAIEAVDFFQSRERGHYLVDEDFED